ncbi:immunoglobulin G-binding protein H-like [Procambarus clarkii]|uniref:immunoglobulin G-binding protein H-like n=1 Tax=Procambarus clarkii TaxID=6728 RepID=UPI003743C7E7
MDEQVAVLVEQPNFGEIKVLKKSGLLYMAEKLKLTVSRRMLKGQLVRVIVTHLVEEEKRDEEWLEELGEESSNQVAILKLEMESKLEMAKLEAEKQRLVMQNRQKQLELETQQQMLEAQNQQRQLEIEAQKQQKQAELEAQSRRIEAQF